MGRPSLQKLESIELDFCGVAAAAMSLTMEAMSSGVWPALRKRSLSPAAPPTSPKEYRVGEISKIAGRENVLGIPEEGRQVPGA